VECNFFVVICVTPYILNRRMTARAEILDVLVAHCRLLAKTRDPRRRIAASEMEIELSDRLAALRRAPLVEFPEAESLAQRAEDPTPPAEGGSR
jgi:hypothetical protein